MRILKRNTRTGVKISLILADWGVRESFHILHYLGKQAVPRELFEVIIVEYYSRVSPAVQVFAEQVDTWVLLEMPDTCYYHKHLLYNAGIALSHGEICVICDSDAMVKDTFLRSIRETFMDMPSVVLHMDEFRNVRRDMYPFNYPRFDEVIGDGCINRVNGITTGLADTEDTLHTRNYGACMCAKKDDLIAIGGADEHIDYLGHICGPYEMTFRLVNYGCREIWHEKEFLYHTWHPGSDGTDNYLGPHDGLNISTTALEAIASGRIHPYEENLAIRNLRNRTSFQNESLQDLLKDHTRLARWDRGNLGHLLAACGVPEEEKRGWKRRTHSHGNISVTSGVSSPKARTQGVTRNKERLAVNNNMPVKREKGFNIFVGPDGYLARLLVFQNPVMRDCVLPQSELYGGNLVEIDEQINRVIPFYIRLTNGGFTIVGVLWNLVNKVLAKIFRQFQRFRLTSSRCRAATGVELKIFSQRTSCIDKVREIRSRFVRAYTNSLLSLNPGLLQVRDLVVNLYLLRGSASLHERLNKVTIVTSSSMAKFYILVLSLIRILPEVNVTRVIKSTHLETILAEYERTGRQETIVMTQSESVRFRDVVLSSPNRNNILCI